MEVKESKEEKDVEMKEVKERHGHRNRNRNRRRRAAARRQEREEKEEQEEEYILQDKTKKLITFVDDLIQSVEKTEKKEVVESLRRELQEPLEKINTPEEEEEAIESVCYRIINRGGNIVKLAIDDDLERKENNSIEKVERIYRLLQTQRQQVQTTCTYISGIVSDDVNIMLTRKYKDQVQLCFLNLTDTDNLVRLKMETLDRILRAMKKEGYENRMHENSPLIAKRKPQKEDDCCCCVLQ